MSDFSEKSDIRDTHWRALLTQAYGEVEAAPEFRSGLLVALKAKTAENAAEAPEPESTDEETGTADAAAWSRLLGTAYEPCHPGQEFKASLLAALKARQAAARAENENAQWSALLSASYVPCQPRPEFQASLLASLKTKQNQAFAAAPVDANAGSLVEDENAIATLLSSSYVPVAPRKEFEVRLLDNLKDRQRSAAEARSRSRRRVIFMSGLSSLAAAAMVLFTIWVMPVADYFKPASGQQAMTFSSAADLPPVPEKSSSIALASLAEPVEIRNEAAGFGALAAPAAYRPSDVFASTSLPGTVRGIGMEINDGGGWRKMDETQLARVEPGMTFRPAAGHARPGLGFDDGTTVHVMPESVINVADKGLRLHSGFMTVEVPASSDRGFFLDFPERDIAIEPGTMLVASVESPDLYADGGAPAPTIMVDDGGLALARGESGYGPLFANQVYEINNYVTPDLPGRPACATECAAIQERMAPFGVVLASQSAGAPRVLTTARRIGVAEVAPKGFAKKGDAWVASEYDGRTTVKIKYLSDEYFGFASRRRDLANALALGAPAIIDGGDGNYYEIHK